MFRKPNKRKGKEGFRSVQRRNEEDENETTLDENNGNKDDETEREESELILESRKRWKGTTSSSSKEEKGANSMIHSFDWKEEKSLSNSELATRSALHLPEESKKKPIITNTLLAGPIAASRNIRVTARFDYQPDICKDYKETGFCGFGDTCIYLHDRGDTLSGWQLEKQWEEEQQKRKDEQEKQMQLFLDHDNNNNNNNNTNRESTPSDDGIPFACYLCREYFKDPIVTNCQHYFCQECIMEHVTTAQHSSNRARGGGDLAAAPCPICHKDTFRVFHQPTKLLAKMKRILGREQYQQPDSWKLFALKSASSKQNDTIKMTNEASF